MKSQTKVPYRWRCYEWCITRSRVGDDCSCIDYKVVVGAGEGNSWWLRQFNGVFRYGFGRLDFEDRWFNFIPRG